MSRRKKKEVPWILLLSGARMPLGDKIDPQLIHVRDIAHVLSNRCVFDGHVLEFFSMAQSGVIVHDYVHKRLSKPLDAESVALCTAALFAEASDAYAHAGPKCVPAIEKAIATRFGYTERDRAHPLIDEAIGALAAATARDIVGAMDSETSTELHGGPPVSEIPQIIPVTPLKARRKFLLAFERLSALRRELSP